MSEDSQPSKLVPEHGGELRPDETHERRERVRRQLEQGREQDLSPEDYQFAIRNGLIEG